MLISYNWLKEYTGNTTKSAQEAADLLGIHAFEIEGVDEKSIEVDILPNRASDSLCHRGIARELSSITNIPLENDPLSKTPELKFFDDVEIKIEDSKACPRFTASLLTGVEIKESPSWLQERLKEIGQRPINNIVDATNYVMFAIGQPMHAYDADLFPRVDGKWQLGVRYAKKGEVVSLIAEGGKNEDREVVMEGTELLVVDNSSDTPIGLAGIKGGRFAGVHAGTTKIIIEAAHFHPTITRQTARRLGIVIDSSKRFENEPSRELPPYAQSEIIKLIKDIAGGEYVGTVDEYLEKQLETAVEVSAERVNSHLGLSLSVGEMESILNRIGCKVTVAGDVITAINPFERTDLNIEEDYIEEIGRIHGYNNVKVIPPEKTPLKRVNKRHYYSELIRDTLIELGFSEIITSSFRNKDKVQLKNALASDKSFLRSSLRNNIEDALDKNSSFIDLLGLVDIRIFEIGTVFYSDNNDVCEHVSLALGIRLKSSGYSGKEDKVLNQALNSLKEKIGIEINFEINKGIAECNLTQLLVELPDKEEYLTTVVGEEFVYQPFSQYPSMSRDIAMWVGESVNSKDVSLVLNEAAGDLRVRTTFIDEFSKDGRKSLAFRLVFQANDRTLTDTEVGDIMDKIYKAVAEQSWEVR